MGSRTDEASVEMPSSDIDFSRLSIQASPEPKTWLPKVLQLVIVDHAVKDNEHQILPSALIQLNSHTRRHALSLLLKDRTLQLKCEHGSYQRAWEVSFCRSTTYLRAPDYPLLQRKHKCWATFRQNFEIISHIKDLYIKFPCFNDLGFCVRFSDDAPPSITVQAARATRTLPDNTLLTVDLRPDVSAFSQAPALCTANWIEDFLRSMRQQCDRTLQQNGITFMPLVFQEMRDRGPFGYLPVQLRAVTPASLAIPKKISPKELSELKKAEEDRIQELERYMLEEWWNMSS